jgi:hypothetical protein
MSKDFDSRLARLEDQIDDEPIRHEGQIRRRFEERIRGIAQRMQVAGFAAVDAASIDEVSELIHERLCALGLRQR